jgi:hypothetical protein
MHKKLAPNLFYCDLKVSIYYTIGMFWSIPNLTSSDSLKARPDKRQQSTGIGRKATHVHWQHGPRTANAFTSTWWKSKRQPHIPPDRTCLPPAPPPLDRPWVQDQSKRPLNRPRSGTDRWTPLQRLDGGPRASVGDPLGRHFGRGHRGVCAASPKRRLFYRVILRLAEFSVRGLDKETCWSHDESAWQPNCRFCQCGKSSSFSLSLSKPRTNSFGCRRDKALSFLWHA